MRFVFFSICILFHLECNAQNTRVISNDKTNEVYSVLIDSPNVKHGSYKLLSNKLVIEKGFYYHGVKDGIWTNFRNDRKAAEGPYKNDKKVGIWNYYEKGNLIQKYDEDKNELIEFKWQNLADTNKYFKVFRRKKIILTQLDSPPMFKGGEEAMKAFFNSHLNFLKEIKTKNTSGIVIVTFTIDKNRKARNYSIIKGIGGGCDEEALRLVHLANGNWISGVLKNKKVDVEYEVSIEFNIEK